jgi:flagellar biosynthesis regulator FlaF
MSDEPGEDRGTDEAHQREVERLRRSSAALASAAEGTAELADRLDALHERYSGISEKLGLSDPADFAEQTRARALSLRLVSDVEAAQAIAQQEMLDAGGPGDDEAYTAFVAATERHTDLLPHGEGPAGGSIE